MSAVAPQTQCGPGASGAQPNEFDRKRIERALAARSRYRYVAAVVRVVAGAYRIESPCCSRNIDPDGGLINVALLEPAAGPTPWLLYRPDHKLERWVLHGRYARLDDALEELRLDVERLFWP